MANCSDISFTGVSGRFFLNNSCVKTNLNSGNYFVSNTFTGANKLSFNREGANTYFALCECSSSLDNSCSVLFWGTSNIPTDYDLDINRYYRFSYRTNDTFNINFSYCEPEQRSTIAIMSEELALGTGTSMFTNLNELTPLFIAIIGFILGYYFLRKIIKKGQKGKTL